MDKNVESKRELELKKELITEKQIIVKDLEKSFEDQKLVAEREKMIRKEEYIERILSARLKCTSSIISLMHINREYYII